MRTAIDTNVISAIWSGEAQAHAIVRDLQEAQAQGGLAISPVAYAELRAYPRASAGFVDEFLTSTNIVVDWGLSEEFWLLVADRFSRHAERRRKSKAPGTKRLLADFMIAAHAVTHADRLMTLDRQRYHRDFPELTLLPD
jgi:predicted nucleic acid-binding protein